LNLYPLFGEKQAEFSGQKCTQVKGIHACRQKTGEHFALPAFDASKNFQGFRQFHAHSVSENFR
jgi:hypothetical protein